MAKRNLMAAGLVVATVIGMVAASVMVAYVHGARF